MIRACFFRRSGVLTGFDVDGHADFAEEGSDIVCSAVSAVVHMTALGISEVLGLTADIRQKDGRVALSTRDAQPAQPFLRALEKELTEIARQYPECVRVTYTERREFTCFS